MNEINILIADAQYLVRSGLQHLIGKREGLRVVAEASDEAELLESLSGRSVDVVILDYDQPGHFSLQTISQVRRKSPGSQILIISADQVRKNVFEALESEVNSYLTKECGEEEIIDAIRATARGEKFFCTNVLNYILEKSLGREDDCSPTPLTPREIEIVRLISRGLIAKEIAAELHLSRHTVYTHRKNIMKKLELSSTSELVLYAIEQGIVRTTSVVSAILPILILCGTIIRLSLGQSKPPTTKWVY